MKPDYIQILAVGALALAVIGVGVGFNLIVQAAEQAAEATMAREEYIQAVLERAA